MKASLQTKGPFWEYDPGHLFRTASEQATDSMSEYQYVEFRAIDAPVTTKNMEYMQRQSSRAEITPWSFTNEYHYGEFRGNAEEMLRRGYDVHLLYANYGIRKLLIRLPHGLPDPAASKPYFIKSAFEFIKDKTGSGGILVMNPYLEDHDWLSDVEGLFEELIGLRSEIQNGDLRPFYLAWLAAAGGGDIDVERAVEGPVPAGLAKPTQAQVALMEFYELSDSLLEAAAVPSPPLSKEMATNHYDKWITRQPVNRKDAWLAELLKDPSSTVRQDIVAAYQKDFPRPAWPTAATGRTMAELCTLEATLQERADAKAVAKAANDRKKQLATLAADYAAVFLKTEQLVKSRSSSAYREIAKLLSDVREALAPTEKAGLAESQAQKLIDSNPTLRSLISALRKADLVPKRKSRTT